MPTHTEGFYANVYRINLDQTTVEDAAYHVMDGLRLGWILTEHPDLGSILIVSDKKDVYVVPAEVMLYLIKQDLISLNPIACGGKNALH